MRRAIATAALTIAALIGPIAGRAVGVPTPAGASQIATAVARDPAVVTGASFQTGPSGTNAVATDDAGLASFPIHGATYGILTSGDATLADDAPQSNFAGVSNGGGPRSPDGSDQDVTVVRIDLGVPANRNCLSVDFRFLSEEFPDFVGGTFNDAFIAELDNSTWTTSGSTITADDNFAFDPSGNVISINSTGVADMTAEAAAGTVYGGATPLLRASTPITEGLHSLFLSIFDQSDMRYDSAVFLDNLILGTQTGEECEEGVEPVGEADLSVELNDSPDPVAEGGLLTYTVTVSNDGPDEALGVTLIDNLPALLDFGSAVPSQGRSSRRKASGGRNAHRSQRCKSVAMLRISATLLCLLAALAVAPPGNGSDPWSKLRRPLHLPRLDPGSACPVSRVDRRVDWERANIFGGSGIGRGPVYPGLGGYPGGRLNLTPDRQYGGSWAGQKVFWYVLPSLPMFLAIPLLLRAGVAFWPTMSASRTAARLRS